MKRLTSIVGALFFLCVTSSSFASDYPLENVLSKEMSEKLAKQKITTTTELIKKAATKNARKKLAKASGIALKELDHWAMRCDLMRIKGIGPQMSKLLHAAKVKVVVKLKKQRAKKLLKAMIEANKTEKITENPPNEEQVKNWILQAKKLKRLYR